MSEKRYYYTDPLAAAYMAKHYGIRFMVRVAGGRSWSAIKFVDGAPYRGSAKVEDERLYVDPESLHLLGCLTENKIDALYALEMVPELERDCDHEIIIPIEVIGSYNDGRPVCQMFPHCKYCKKTLIDLTGDEPDIFQTARLSKLRSLESSIIQDKWS